MGSRKTTRTGAQPAAKGRNQLPARTSPRRTPVIKLTGITKIYDGSRIEVRALDDVDLEIYDGDYLAIMGPSGSGKSTLMHILGCLDVPTTGSYLLDDEEVSGYDEDRLAEVRSRKLGFVFQQFNLLPRLTAAQNVELPLLYSRIPVEEREKVVSRMLDAVSIGDRSHHRPNELSGGETQRVAIARALANDPALILADEPTGNLDSKTEEEIMSLLNDLNRQGRTLVIVTHDDTVAAHAKRVINLKDGRLV